MINVVCSGQRVQLSAVTQAAQCLAPCSRKLQETTTAVWLENIVRVHEYLSNSIRNANYFQRLALYHDEKSVRYWSRIEMSDMTWGIHQVLHDRKEWHKRERSMYDE